MSTKLVVIVVCIIVALAIVWAFVYGPFNYNARNDLRGAPDYEAQQQMGDLPDKGDFRGFDENDDPIYENAESGDVGR